MVIGNQKWQVGAFLLGAPFVILAVAIEGEIESAIAPGPYSPDVVFIALFLGLFMLCFLPSYLYFRRICVDDHGIVGFRYVGPRNHIAWPAVKSVEMFTVTRGDEATDCLIVLPKQGRRIVFKSSQTSNFDELVRTVEERSPVAMTRHPPRQAVSSSEM